jgi:hypothetical protein
MSADIPDPADGVIRLLTGGKGRPTASSRQRRSRLTAPLDMVGGSVAPPRARCVATEGPWTPFPMPSNSFKRPFDSYAPQIMPRHGFHTQTRGILDVLNKLVDVYSWTNTISINPSVTHGFSVRFEPVRALSSAHRILRPSSIRARTGRHPVRPRRARVRKAKGRCCD